LIANPSALVNATQVVLLIDGVARSQTLVVPTEASLVALSYGIFRATAECSHPILAYAVFLGHLSLRVADATHRRANTGSPAVKMDIRISKASATSLFRRKVSPPDRANTT